MSQRKGSALKSRYLNSTISSSRRSIENKITSTPGSNISAMTSDISPALSTNSSASSIIIQDTTPSQKFMQHKLDMAYNKYLQNMALQNILEKKYASFEYCINEQLTHYGELYERSVEDEQEKQSFLQDMITAKDLELRMQFLEKSLETSCAIIDPDSVIKLEKFIKQLHIFCDKLCMKNIVFVSNEENYTRLHQTLDEILKILNEINDGNSKEFLVLVQTICKINELLTKLRKNNEIAKRNQTKINELVLRAASVELSRTKKI